MRADPSPFWTRIAASLVLGIALTGALRAQEEAAEWEEEALEVVEAPAWIGSSYRVPVTGLPVVQTEAAREAGEVLLRLAGWRPRREPIETPPVDRLDPASPSAWILARGDGAGLVVELASPDSLTARFTPAPYRDESLAAVLAEMREDWNNLAPAGREEPWQADPTALAAGELWQGLAHWFGVPETWIQRFAWVGGEPPAIATDAAVIDRSWRARWERLSATRTEAFAGDPEYGEDPAAALVEWTRLALVQGVFNARLEPLTAARWFGRAWLGADLLVAANPDNEIAAAMASEIRAMARRYGAGEWGEAPVTRVLPEFRQSWDFDQTPFEAGAPTPPIAGAFDYLVRRESYLQHPEAEAVRAAFLQQGGLDALDRLLIDFKDNSRLFQANQTIYNLGYQLFRSNRMTIVAFALSQLHDVLPLDPPPPGREDLLFEGDAPLKPLLEPGQDTSSDTLWLELDQGGVHGFSYESAPTIEDPILALQLVTLRRVESALKLRTGGLDPSWGYSWADAWPEVRGWMLRLSWGRRERSRQIGAEAAMRQADQLWARAGFAQSAPLPGDKSSRPNAAWQDGFEAAWRDLRAAYFIGRAESMADEIEPLLQSTDQQSRELLVFALHFGLAAGRGDAVMRQVVDRVSSGFSKDSIKQYLVCYRPELAAEFEEFIRPANTNSANDYLARAHWAVQMEAWAEVHEIADAYHYGQSPLVNLLRLVSRWWIDGEISASDRQALTGHLLSEMETRMRSPLDHYDQWFGKFEARFAGDPDWEAVKAETQIDRVAASSRALKRLREPMTETELTTLAAEMRAIAAGFTVESFSRVWQAAALEAEHLALGRWLVSATRQFTAQPDETRQRIAELVAVTRPLVEARSMIALDYPAEGVWLRAAVMAGADPTALAEWLAASQATDVWLAREPVLLRAAARQPEVFAELLRRLPYADNDGGLRLPTLRFKSSLLAEIARELEQPELVGLAAVGAWVEEKDFAPLAACWTDEATALAWMNRNAIGLAQRDAWLATWRRSRADAADEALAVPVPELSDYLTAAEAVATRS